MPQWVSPKRIDRANCTNLYGRTCPDPSSRPNSGVAATDPLSTTTGPAAEDGL